MPRKLVQRVTLDTSEARRAWRRLREEAEDYEDAARSAMARGPGRQMAESADEAADATEELRRETKRAERAVDELGDEAQETEQEVADIGDGAAGLAAVRLSARRAGQQLGHVGTRAAEAAHDLRFGNFSGAFYALRQIGPAARGAAVAIGGTVAAALAAATAYGAAAAQAISFESALVEVSKTTDITGDRLQELGEDLQSMAGRLGVAQKDLASIAGTAGQIGIEGQDNILAFTEAIAKISEATNLTAREASEGFAKVAEAFELPITKVEHLGSAINELSNTTAASTTEILKGVRRMSAAAANLGLSADQAAAFQATLVDMGMRARRAGTRLRRFFNTAQESAGQMAEQIGMSAQAFREMLATRPAQALRRYARAMGQLSKQQQTIQLGEVFGESARQAIMGLIAQTDNLNENLETTSTQMEKNTSITEEFGRVLGTVSKQWNKLWENIKEGAARWGATALPALQSMLAGINNLFAGTKELADQLERLNSEQESLQSASEALRVYRRWADDTERTAEQQKKLNEAVETLKEQFPGYIRQTKNATGTVKLFEDALEGAIEQQRILNQEQAQQKTADLAETFRESTRTIKENRERLKAWRKELQRIQNLQEEGEERVEIGYTPSMRTGVQSDVDIEEAETWLSNKIANLNSELRNAESEVRASTRAMLKPFTDGSDIDVQGLADRLKASMDLTFDEALERAREFKQRYKDIIQPDGEPRDLFDTDFQFPDPEGSSDGGGGGPSDEFLRKRKQAREILRDTRNYLEAQAAATDRERQLLEDVVRLKKRERRLEDALKSLSGDNREEAQKQLETIRNRREAKENELGQTNFLLQKAKKLSESLSSLNEGELPGFAQEKINEQKQALEDLNDELTRLRNKREADPTFTDEDYQQAAAQKVKEYRKQLRKAYNALKETLDLTDKQEEAFDEFFSANLDELEESNEGLEDLSKKLRGVGRAVDGIARLADTFGDLEENTRRALDATSSLITSIGELAASGGTSVTGWVSAATSVASLIGSALAGEEEGRSAEEMQKLRQQLRDNARALQENTQAMREEGVVGKDVAPETLAEARSIIRQMRDEMPSETVTVRGPPPPNEGDPPTEDEVTTWLTQLEETGIEGFQGVIDTFKTLTEYTTPGQALRALLGKDATWLQGKPEDVQIPDISKAFDKLEKQFGEFGDSFEGLTAEFEMRLGLLNESLQSAVDELLGDIGKLDLSSELRARITEGLSDFDLSTQDGRKGAIEFLRGLGADLAEGNLEDLLGATTPAQFRKLLQKLISSIESGGSGAGNEFSRDVQIAKSITEIQANEMVSLLDNILRVLDKRLPSAAARQMAQMRRDVQSQQPTARPAPSKMPSASGGGAQAHVTANIEVGAGPRGAWNDQLITEIGEALMRELRQKSPNGVY